MSKVNINSEKYIKNFIPRMAALLEIGAIGIIKTDADRFILCEVWHFPERRETDPDNEVEIYPIAKFLTDEEMAELKMEGQTPETE